MEDKEKLNVLILSWRGPGHPHAGGAEESTHQHAKGWIKAGHQVTLFTSYYSGAKEEAVIDGVKVIRRGSQIFGVHWQAFWWFSFVRSEKFDLVIDQFHGIPFFTPLYIKAKKIAFIHEVTKEVWRLNPWPMPFNAVPSIVGTLFEPLIFKAFYKNIPFMTVSESTKEDLIEWGISKNNVTVIHNGFDDPNYPKNKKETRKTIIYLGALSKDKGIEDALIVFRNLYENIKNIQFWVVGKGEDHFLTHLKKQAKLLGIEKVTKFFGFVSEKEKYSLLSKAHILINPSVREGWGLVVLEAAAMGTPTVGYNVAGLKDSILNDITGVLCDPNPNACAEAVLSLANDGEKYQKLQQNCIKWSKKFNWEKSSEESLKLIEKLVNI